MKKSSKKKLEEEHPVTKISGIGINRAFELERFGYNNVKKIANAKKTVLMQFNGIGKKTAGRFIKEANKLRKKNGHETNREKLERELKEDTETLKREMKKVKKIEDEEAKLKNKLEILKSELEEKKKKRNRSLFGFDPLGFI